MLHQGVARLEFEISRNITNADQHRPAISSEPAGHRGWTESSAATPPWYLGLTEDFGRMMSASSFSATSSAMTLKEPFACVLSNARRNW